jgi:hypothetical protein
LKPIDLILTFIGNFFYYDESIYSTPCAGGTISTEYWVYSFAFVLVSLTLSFIGLGSISILVECCFSIVLVSYTGFIGCYSII